MLKLMMISLLLFSQVSLSISQNNQRDLVGSRCRIAVERSRIAGCEAVAEVPEMTVDLAIGIRRITPAECHGSRCGQSGGGFCCWRGGIDSLAFQALATLGDMQVCGRTLTQEYACSKQMRFVGCSACISNVPRSRQLHVENQFASAGKGDGKITIGVANEYADASRDSDLLQDRFGPFVCMHLRET